MFINMTKPRAHVAYLFLVAVIWEFLSATSHTHAQYYTFTLAQRKSQQGSAGQGDCGAGPGFDLPLHCYLLLQHKGAPWRAALSKKKKKARQRMIQLKLCGEEDPHLSSMGNLSSMNTIYATGSLFSKRPPLLPLFHLVLLSHSQESFLSSVFCLILFSHPFSFFFYRINQERCSPSIAN